MTDDVDCGQHLVVILPLAALVAVAIYWRIR